MKQLATLFCHEFKLKLIMQDSIKLQIYGCSKVRLSNWSFKCFDLSIACLDSVEVYANNMLTWKIYVENL